MAKRACYDKGCKRSDCEQHKWNRLCVQGDSLHHVSDLIKPCHVALKIMKYLPESICESSHSIECKKKKYKETKEVECDVLSSSSSKEEMNNTSMELIGNVHPERNDFTKGSDTSKPCIINSSLNCKTPYLPYLNLKNVDENSRQSYKGTKNEIENEVPSNRNIKNVQTRKSSSSERYRNLKIKICEIPQKDYGLFVDNKRYYYVPVVGSAVKIFSEFPAKPKTVQGDFLLSSLNNSNPNCALNPVTQTVERVENASNKNFEEAIETLEEHADQKNLKGTIPCCVLITKLPISECLKFNVNENVSQNIQSKHAMINRYNRLKIYKNFKPNSSLNKLKRKSSLRKEDLTVKKIKTKANNSKVTVKTETVGNYSNVICDSDYKCVQCRKPITNDVELYHHLCRGKRIKGFICEICERIFETVRGLKIHLNYHYKFIKFL